MHSLYDKSHFRNEPYVKESRYSAQSPIDQDLEKINQSHTNVILSYCFPRHASTERHLLRRKKSNFSSSDNMLFLICLHMPEELVYDRINCVFFKQRYRCQPAPLASLFSKVAERSGVKRRLGPKKNMLLLP